jgi:hypothetical protein
MKFSRGDAPSRSCALVNQVKLPAFRRVVALRGVPRSLALAGRANSAFLAAMCAIDPAASIT